MEQTWRRVGTREGRQRGGGRREGERGEQEPTAHGSLKRELSPEGSTYPREGFIKIRGRLPIVDGLMVIVATDGLDFMNKGEGTRICVLPILQIEVAVSFPAVSDFNSCVSDAVFGSGSL